MRLLQATAALLLVQQLAAVQALQRMTDDYGIQTTYDLGKQDGQGTCIGTTTAQSAVASDDCGVTMSFNYAL